METALRVIGDGLSIAALAIISSTALGAWKRIPKSVAVPMQWGLDGKASWRASKPVGLLLIPFASMAVIFAFTLSGVTFKVQGLEATMVLCVRATLAALLALAQLLHLRFAIKTLLDEGSL
jgi:uncharacterized membrane protein